MNGAIQLGIYGVHDLSKGQNPVLIHDHNLAVFSGGKLRHYIHLERYTRNKFDASLSRHIEKICRDLGIAGRKAIELCFADHELGKAFISSEGKIRFEGTLENRLDADLKKGKAYWFGSEVPAFWISHEVAHLYSCIPFYGPFKENSLLIHYDGGASVSSFSAWVFRNDKLICIDHHYRFKWLTNLFNANALVFRLTETSPKYHNSVPGKFMGLASFGSYRKDIERWLTENSFFHDIWSSPGSFLEKLEKDWNLKLGNIDNHQPFLQDIAATIHEIFIRESLKEILSLQKKTSAKILYFTGGCALSIKLNSALRKVNIFEKIFIPPCTNDAGLSIGAAVALSLKKGFGIERLGPYIGSWKKEGTDIQYDTQDLREIAGMLANHKVIGICNGNSETGPRALGNRSLLARADSKELSVRISQRIKEREWYRPLAPVMLAEFITSFTGLKKIPESACYMLFDFKIETDKIDELRGVVHVDGTARIQLLEERDQNPFLYDLLKICSREFGLRALINTSFNRKGEPIVQNPQQAEESAREMHLDGLVINGRLMVF
jgi:carbamoyltransferase